MLVALWAAAAAPALADQAADEAAIRESAAKYVDAYNRRDSKTMASMWSPDAVYTDAGTGQQAVGRENIAKQLERSLANDKDSKLSVQIESVEFVSPNVAVERGTAEIARPKTNVEKTQYTAVHVKRDGKWLLDRIAEADVPAPPPSNYEHLKELEWMIGSWVDQDEAATIHTDCEWTKNRNFITRSFAVVIGNEVNKSGMQVIGWDPVAKQIRSWVFDSDGGFSDGKWKHKGDKWFVHQTGTLPDGGKTSALNIFTRVDDSSFTWQSTDRVVDGEVLPNIDEVLVVRKPAE
jgi:uncharacterized protein (TIGR02246 family)